MIIEDYINSNYIVAWQHPDSTVKDWKRFLLEEDHDDAEVRKVNGAFISLAASEDSLLVVESEEKLKRCRFPKRHIRQFYIQSPYITPDRIFGWDMKDWILLHDSKAIGYEIAEHLLQNTKTIEELDFKKEMLSLWNSGIEKDGDSEILAAEDLNKHMEEGLISIAEEVQEFVKNEIEPLTIKAQDASQRMDVLLRILNQYREKIALCKGQSELDEYNSKADECSQAYLEAMNEWLNCLNKKRKLLATQVGKLIDKRYQLVDAHFPLRTHDMRHTLENIHRIVFYRELFLIAGSHHLEEDQDKEPRETDPYSLKELYSFLATHKDIVILRPKILK